MILALLAAAPAAAPAPAEPEPDPVENYVDYDTEGDIDISEAPEFGVPVVERLLGGDLVGLVQPRLLVGERAR